MPDPNLNNPFTDQEATDIAWCANGGSDSGTYSPSGVQSIGIGMAQAALDLIKAMAAQVRKIRSGG